MGKRILKILTAATALYVAACAFSACSNEGGSTMDRSLMESLQENLPQGGLQQDESSKKSLLDAMKDETTSSAAGTQSTETDASDDVTGDETSNEEETSGELRLPENSGDETEPPKEVPTSRPDHNHFSVYDSSETTPVISNPSPFPTVDR